VDCGLSSSPLQLADVGSSGVVHLSASPSSVPDDADCGSDAAPWLISAHRGQRVRVTLLDFDVSAAAAAAAAVVQPSSSSPNDTASTDRDAAVCSSSSWGQTVYALVGDATGAADNVTVCGGVTSQPGARSRVVYETVGHVVEIRMPLIGRQQAVARQRRTSFVLRVSGKLPDRLLPPY